MLTTFLLLPAVGALILLFLPEDVRLRPRPIDVRVSVLAFAVSIAVFVLCFSYV
jgi:hypothetical protein